MVLTSLRYTIYSTSSCPRCEQLKNMLKGWGIDYEAVDMATPEALTELRINSVFTLTAPVLQVDGEFYTVEQLFDGNNIKDLEKMGLRK